MTSDNNVTRGSSPGALALRKQLTLYLDRFCCASGDVTDTWDPFFLLFFGALDDSSISTVYVDIGLWTCAPVDLWTCGPVDLLTQCCHGQGHTKHEQEHEQEHKQEHEHEYEHEHEHERGDHVHVHVSVISNNVNPMEKSNSCRISLQFLMYNSIIQ